MSFSVPLSTVLSRFLASFDSSLSSRVSSISFILSEFSRLCLSDFEFRLFFHRVAKEFLPRLLTRGFSIFLKCVIAAAAAVNWLLQPAAVVRLFCRHSLALVLLWLLSGVWRSLFHRSFKNLFSRLRAFLLHPNYLQQEIILMETMDSAASYLDWRRAANELDRLQGKGNWKESARSAHYDWKRIRDDLKEFRHLVDDRNIRGIMLFSRARLCRNLVGINDRRLFSELRAGTKRLIEEYLAEVVRALQLVCMNDSTDSGCSPADKLSFFNECRHAYGRSALLLSGGATLGLYHTGVCKALFDNNLLPRVMSGSSVGSIIVALMGTKNDSELKSMFDSNCELLNLNFFPPGAGSVKRKLGRLFSTGVLMDIAILQKCVQENIPNMTFAEAYEHSGRIINIVVSPARTNGNQDGMRLLNYLTAPNVLVWSAAVASCAIPGVYQPVELLCKSENGESVKYFEGSTQVRWEDGSVQADLPMRQLSELFNINHFIVSQVNPHVVPFISSDSSTEATAGSFFKAPLTRLMQFLSSAIRDGALNLMNLNLLPTSPGLRYILQQHYTGNITLVPKVNPSDYSLLLTNPSPDRLKHCIATSERESWKLMPAIKASCEVEFTLDECVRRMRGAIILEELSSARRLNRVRSFSTEMFRRQKSVENDEAAKKENQEKPRNWPRMASENALNQRNREGENDESPSDSGEDEGDGNNEEEESPGFPSNGTRLAAAGSLDVPEFRKTAPRLLSEYDLAQLDKDEEDAERHSEMQNSIGSEAANIEADEDLWYFHTNSNDGTNSLSLADQQHQQPQPHHSSSSLSTPNQRIDMAIKTKSGSAQRLADAEHSGSRVKFADQLDSANKRAASSDTESAAVRLSGLQPLSTRSHSLSHLTRCLANSSPPNSSAEQTRKLKRGNSANKIQLNYNQNNNINSNSNSSNTGNRSASESELESVLSSGAELGLSVASSVDYHESIGLASSDSATSSSSISLPLSASELRDLASQTSQGLPKTLSHLELTSDVTTLP